MGGGERRTLTVRRSPAAICIDVVDFLSSCRRKKMNHLISHMTSTLKLRHRPLKYVSWAARFGQLEMLQWARASGCPWNAATCSEAALGGHLEVLQWARANGCPWDHHTRDVATGHVLEWAVANGVP